MTTDTGTKPALPEPVEPKKEAIDKESVAEKKAPAITSPAAVPEPKETGITPSEQANLEAPAQETRDQPQDGVVKTPEVKPQGVLTVGKPAAQTVQSTPVAVEGAPVTPAAGGPSAIPAPAVQGSPAEGGAEKHDVAPQGDPQVQKTPVPGTQPAPAAEGDDDFSIFDSQADLEEIFSAMADVKKEEANAIATAVQAIEQGQDASTALQSLSSDVAEKIQKQLEERSAAEEEHFVTEEEFVAHAKDSMSKTWYHCLYFLAFKSESGIASKKVLYEALKEPLSKSPVDVVPEHMFNFGLSSLIKVQLYEKPVVLFKRGGEFKLDVNRKKIQELLTQIGRPLSKRPVVTRKETKKYIDDFFSNEKLF